MLSLWKRVSKWIKCFWKNESIHKPGEIDHRLPHRQTTVCQAEWLCFRHCSQWHWSTTGDCVLSCTVHPIHIWALPYTETLWYLAVLGMDRRRQTGPMKNFVRWYESNQLQLNTSKTKVMVMDFFRNKRLSQSLSIHGVDVEIVRNYKYLGLQLNDRLDWTTNMDILLRKG